MRIKKVEINGEKLRFNKNDNLIFIKENKKYGSIFIESLQKVFRRHLIDINGVYIPETNIKCVCEKGGIDFTIRAFVIWSKIITRRARETGISLFFNSFVMF